MNPTRARIVLTYIIDGSRVLLGLKKERLGTGLWNGLGGKIEPNETDEEAANRELGEEAKIRALDLSQAGTVFVHNDAEGLDFEILIFVATRWEGEPQETEEMRPCWFPISDIPYQQMFPLDAHWFPTLLSRQRFCVHAETGLNHKVVNVRLEILSS